MAAEMSLREAREKVGLSLREAAKKLGITHAYLSGLELGHKPLKEDRANDIIKTYGLKSSVKLIQALPTDANQFLSWISEQLKWWDSRFVLPMIPAVTSTIDELFVPPSFTGESGDYLTVDELISNLFTDPKQRGLLLSGTLGSGKSFFLRLLVLDTKRLLAHANVVEQYVPFFISLNDFELKPGSLTQSIAEYYIGLGYPGSQLQLETFVRQTIDRGRALILFDGLDEISKSSDRSAMFAKIEHIYSSSFRKSGNKLIISGQPDAFYTRQGGYESFYLARLEHWRPSQMYEACMRWSWDTPEQAHRFWHLIQGNSALYELARWPLLFHLLTTLHSAHGLSPFQELAGLYDACCEVMENSWSSARRVLVSQFSSDSKSADLAWLKWRHFLIHLMQYANNRALTEGKPIDFSFSAAEVSDVWEQFLQERGISRQSLEFAKLQDLILLNKRVGPLLCKRVQDGSGREREVFTFLERSFGEFYLAKALINDPDNLESLILEHLRDRHWTRVIPLILQDLGRSERLPERKLGESLLQTVVTADDKLQLEHRHQIGLYGMFAAMRSIGPYNLERFKDVIDTFLIHVFGEHDLILYVERTAGIAWRILGEFNAVPQIRKLCTDRFEELFGANPQPEVSDDYRWSVLTVMALIGEKFDFVTGEFERNLRSSAAMTQSVLAIKERVALRRQFWRIRQVGRIFVQDESLRGDELKTVEKLRGSILTTLESLVKALDAELKSAKFNDYQYWYTFSVILKSLRKLHYSEELKHILKITVRLILEHWDTICSERYRYRIQMMQYLKAAVRYSYLIEDSQLNNLISLLESIKEDLPPEEVSDIETALILCRLKKETNSHALPKAELYQSVYGECNQALIEKWADTIRKQSDKVYENVIELGTAVACLGQFKERIPDGPGPYGLEAIIKAVLKAYQIEKSSKDEQKREENRCFTRPFSDYGFPLYDHFYITLEALATLLPVEKAT